MASEPKVTVVTPVLNGAKYVAEAMESVLAQRYRNWDYVILDNCSSDATPEIVRAYSRREPRIRVFTNSAVLPIMDNWNAALRHLPADSAYCKVLHADDWLEADCLARMVALAEAQPSVAMVSSYVARGRDIDGRELPTDREVLPGPEVCREVLLGRCYPFGSPSALLMRADLVRRRAECFYDRDYVHADLKACYDLLIDRDFGFVHDVLSHRRLHAESMYSTYSGRYNTHMVEYMGLLWRYGPIYLDPATFRQEAATKLRRYRRILARRTLLRGAAYWRYHKQRMAGFGYHLGPRDLAAGLGHELAELLLHPRYAARALDRLATGRALPASGGS